MPRLLALLLFAAPAVAAPDGAAIFKEQCARCHGDAGQGVKKKYDKPLVGELAVPQLGEQIRKTMPEGHPETLTKEEAAAVAEYIHGAFYSKNALVREDLARLTVQQFRNAASDVIGSFRPGTNKWADGGKGLKGEYFANRSYGNRVIERNDPQVAFDFKTDPPTDGKYDENEFSVRWTGSLLAPSRASTRSP